MSSILKSVALVTGASERIGRGIALSLAQSGWIVAVHFSAAATSARETVETIQFNGGRAEAFPADFRNEADVKSLIPHINERLGLVTCLINNASVFGEDNIASATRETWDAHMEVNLRAPFVLCQALVKYLPREEPANIINILDQRVLNLTPQFVSYTISKSALWTITQTTASALAPNVRVNAIGPGPTLPSTRQSDEDFKRQYKSMPLERPVSVSEICAAVGFILNTPSMTGQMITLDAGQQLGWAQPGQQVYDEE